MFRNTLLIFVCFISTIRCSDLNLSLLRLTTFDVLQNKANICDLIQQVDFGCLDEYLLALCHAEEWAVKMFDATGKIPPGILNGNIIDLGSYDECLGIHEQAKKIKGQYCLASLNIKEIDIPFTIGLCVPNTCTSGDITNLTNKYFEFTIQDGLCQSEDTRPEITTGDIICIIFFSIILLLIILSTSYESYLYYSKKEPMKDGLLAFSILKNGTKLFTVIEKPNQLKCIAGIRTLSMMWVILAHGYTNISYKAPINNYDMLEWLQALSSMYILGGTVAVDSFFVMGGIVLMYVFLGTMKKDQYFNVPMYYVHRYLRLTPALAAMVLVHVTVLKHFGSGPNWPLVDKLEIEGCREYWWTTLLYVQNYVNSTSSCVGQSWYLSVDMQLFILSPLILIPIRKYVNVTLCFIAALAVASSAATFYIAWYYSIPGVITVAQNLDFMNKYYLLTHTRAGPWLIGLIVGFYVFKYKQAKKPFKINHLLNTVLWIVSILVLCACLFGGNNLVTATEFNKFDHSAYLSLARPAWALALSWIIFSSVTGYGGPINAFLSLPLFQVLSRFTYSMYIVHMTILTSTALTTRHTTVFSDFNQMMSFWGDFMLSFGIAIIWTLMFESPIIELEKLLFGGCNKKTEKEVKQVSKIQDLHKNFQLPKTKLGV